MNNSKTVTIRLTLEISDFNNKGIKPSPNLNLLPAYLTATNPKCGENIKLTLSYMKPHKPINVKTIFRWFKDALKAFNDFKNKQRSA